MCLVRRFQRNRLDTLYMCGTVVCAGCSNAQKRPRPSVGEGVGYLKGRYMTVTYDRYIGVTPRLRSVRSAVGTPPVSGAAKFGGLSYRGYSGYLGGPCSLEGIRAAN